MTEYGYTVEIPEGYDEAVVRTRLALRGEGFSILTEAHVGGLLDPDAGADRQYLIMGAWNSAISRPVGDPDLQVGLHLPCNVVVHETTNTAIVAALDPADTVDTSDPQQLEVVDAARRALARVLEKVASPR